MKRMVLLLIILALAGLLAYRLFSRKEPTAAEMKDQPLHVGKNSNHFDSAFAQLLNEYYGLKDALVEWDTLKADQQVYTLAKEADSLPFKEMRADSNIVLTAKSLSADLGGEARNFLSAAGIAQKRRSFNALTDFLYNLIRTVRYDGQTIYHMRCPMAFDDSVEAYWLTNNSKIINPYLGAKHPTYRNKMLGCGEIDDSLHFSK